MEEKMSFSGKKVLVMGLGLHGGGVGTVRFLARAGAKITVTDLRSRKDLAPSLAALADIRGITYILGRHRVRDFERADIVIKNPGVRPDSSYLAVARKRGAKITSDIGIFFDRCPSPIIGVTGTRGKSTTTYLIWKLLKTKFGSRVHYGGNIRKSALLLLPKIEKGDIVVLELSSFQLSDLREEKKSPHIAVFTNIMGDHLNWHKDMREYQDAKRAIFRFQEPEDDLFFNIDDAQLRRLTASTHSRLHAIAASVVLGHFRHSNILKNVGMSEIIDRNLGAHYRTSVALAIAVARHFRIPASAIKKTLSGFRGLPERQEEIAVKNNMHFVDDTTATTPDAAVAAIRRFRQKAGAGRLILIAGGSDKKLDFKTMIAEIRAHIDALVLLPGSATEELKKSFGARRTAPEIRAAKSMDGAVQIAWTLGRPGDYILLSPGAASFGLFLNEFDRGAQFQKAVKKLR